MGKPAQARRIERRRRMKRAGLSVKKYRSLKRRGYSVDDRLFH